MAAVGGGITLYSAIMNEMPCFPFGWTVRQCLLLLCTVFCSFADSANEILAAALDNSLLPLSIRVVDADNSPISGVTVRMHGLRMKVGRGVRFDWKPDQYGPPPEAVTDSDGRVQLVYPEWTAPQQSTGSVECSFDHPSYVAVRAEIAVDDDSPQVSLRDGVRLAVTATLGETEERLAENIYGLLCGHRRNAEWQLFSNGTLMSRTVSADRNRLRIVHLSDNGPPLWSELLRLEHRNNAARVMLRNVPLSPGMHLEGQLADEVPRPIVNGYVSIVATEHTGMRDPERGMQWSDWKQIDSNGHFNFPSLPRNGFVQLFAYCDGWNSAGPTPQDLEKVGLAEFRAELQRGVWYPQVLRLGKGKRTCEVPMIPTATCRIQVVDAEGHAVSDATVTAHSQQNWISGGAEPVGTGFRMAQFMKLSVAEQSRIRDRYSVTRRTESDVVLSLQHKYQQKTDADGWATMGDLPVGRDDEIRTHMFSAVKEETDGPLVANLTSVAVGAGWTGQLTLRISSE